MAKEEETKRVIPQRQNVHVVFFSCQNCGEEADYIQFCPDCGKPMRVIDVVEKFGDEAEAFIKKVEDRLAAEAPEREEENYISLADKPESNVIILEEHEHVDSDLAIDEVDTLGDIFPDDDSDGDLKPSKSVEELSDLDDIVAELDKEDDDFSMDDFGDEGLPEL